MMMDRQIYMTWPGTAWCGMGNNCGCVLFHCTTVPHPILTSLFTDDNTVFLLLPAALLLLPLMTVDGGDDGKLID